MSEVSVPQIVWKMYEYNAQNPFKRRIRREHLHCNLCHEDVLPHGITRIEHWNIIRNHLKLRHKIEVGKDVPMRLVSTEIWKRFVESDSKRRDEK